MKFRNINHINSLEIKQVKIKVNMEAKNADCLNTIINKKIKIIGMNARNVSILFNY